MQEIVVAAVADFANGERRLVHASGKEIVVLKAPQGFRAYENRCAHQGGPVCQGRIVGRTEVTVREDGSLGAERHSDEQLHLVCPWHGWEFDVDTGRCAADPRAGLRAFDVVVRGDDVFLRI